MDDESSLPQPHDRLLKATFSKLENARSFFETQLPPALLNHLHWDSLQLIPNSFVDPAFQTSECDLLFSVSFKDTPLLLYLLFEHQSTEDPRMAFRLLCYAINIWKRFIQDNPRSEPLPPIYPLVLAQGKRPWNVSTHLKSLVPLPEELEEVLRPFQPNLQFHLMQLAQTPFEDLTGTAEAVLTLRLLKASPLGQLLGPWVWDEELLERISLAAVELWARYIHDAVVDREVFLQRLQSLTSPAMKTTSMTLAQQFVEQGRQEGRQQGALDSARQAVLQALEIKHGPLPAGLTELIEQVADLDRLKKLLQHAILSTSLEAFTAQL
jgi:predicted transposase YdaD